MSSSKTRTVLLLWALALALSAVLAAAGERWPQPLQPQALPIGVLLIGLPALMALWLLSRWSLHPPAGPAQQVRAPDRGESGQ